MTKNFENLISLLFVALTGNHDIDTSDYCFADIYSLAKSQQIRAVVFPVIKELKQKQKIAIDENLYKHWESIFYSQIVFSLQRNKYMGGLIKRLDERGITNCILKGIALSELYPVPDSRVSSDVDLLIPDKNHHKTVVDILEADGFHIGSISEASHQIECNHPRFGLVEVHTDICDEIAKTVWFENSIELPAEFVKRDDGVNGFYYTLPVTDNAIFVTFHFLKHFLSHGCGVRQLLDMLLYLKKHESAIDWDKYNSLFAKLNYLKFIDRCKDIGNLYFGMDFEVPDSNKDLCASVLTDMENGGIFGYNEEYRMSFTHHYTKMRSTTASHSQSRFRNFVGRCVQFTTARKCNPLLIIQDYWNKREKEKISASEVSSRLALFKDLGFFGN